MHKSQKTLDPSPKGSSAFSIKPLWNKLSIRDGDAENSKVRSQQTMISAECLSADLGAIDLPDTLSSSWAMVLDKIKQAQSVDQVREALESCLSLLKKAVVSDSILKEIHDGLAHLISSLDSVSFASGQLDVLKKNINKNFQIEAVTPVLDSVVNIVQEQHRSAEKERDEMESFLSQMSENLADIDKTINLSVKSQYAIYEQRRQMDKTLEGETDEMSTIALQAKDLSLLKTSIQKKVSNIRSHMTTCQLAEEKNQQQVETELVALTHRLQEMEQETKKLKTQVRKERQHALVDSLTTVGNRRAYDERTALEYQRWKRYKKPLAIIFADLDRFKAINDNYGHGTGDKVIETVAKKMAKLLRASDFIARIGGEEFSIILPESTKNEALKVAEKLREMIEKITFKHADSRIAVTMSFGVTEYRDNDTRASVLDRADQALYKAKQRGRNQCVVQ